METQRPSTRFTVGTEDLFITLLFVLPAHQAHAEDLTQGIICHGLARVWQLQGRRFVHDVAVPPREQSGQDALPADRSLRPEAQASDGEIPERWPSVARRTDPAQQLVDRLAIQNAVRMLSARLPSGIHDARHRRLQARTGCDTPGGHGWHFEVANPTGSQSQFKGRALRQVARASNVDLNVPFGAPKKQ